MSMRTRVVILVAILGGIYFAGRYLPNDRCPAKTGKCKRSYAYVTGAESDYAKGMQAGNKVDKCSIVARLPRKLLDAKPSTLDPELLDGATRIDERQEDRGHGCDAWLHTWRAVAFDPKHRAHAVFLEEVEDAGINWSRIGMIVVGVIIVLHLLHDKYGERFWRWRLHRRDAKHERARAKIQADLAEIRKRNAEQNARIAAGDIPKL